MIKLLSWTTINNVLETVSKKLSDFVYHITEDDRGSTSTCKELVLWVCDSDATIYRPHHHQRQRWWQRRFPLCPTTPDIPRRELPPPPLLYALVMTWKAVRFINQGERGRRLHEPLTVELLIIIQCAGRAIPCRRGVDELASSRHRLRCRV